MARATGRPRIQTEPKSQNLNEEVDLPKRAAENPASQVRILSGALKRCITLADA
jgi:hypothetical protein